MKKIIIIFIALVTCFYNMQISADEQGIAVKSDIRAFIDYTPIESYLINEYTYIPAEQLANYGFDVSYDVASHSLNIFRKKFVTPIYTKEIWEASVSKQVHADIIDSDVKVYLDGQVANSYAIHGQILLMFDELQKYGTVEWDEYSKQISVTIFKDELQRELDNAEGVVSTEYKTIEGYNNNVNVKYSGQVDENNQPNGIGMSDFTFRQTCVKYLGYFSNGKPNGLVYKETFHTVSSSYTNRNIRFIGKIDGNKESKREYVKSESGGITLLREPNFGISILPRKEIPEWTGPEILPDKTVYTEGCYSESLDGKDGSYEYRIWCDGNSMQTITYVCSGGGEGRGAVDKLRKANQSISSTTDFYEYTNGIKSFYNGSIQSISGTGTTDDPIILNDPAVGGGQSPLVISVLLNGTELSFDVLPIIQNERVLVPVRAIFESLGAKVSWNEETQTVTAIRGSKTIYLQIDNNIMQVDDRTLNLDASPKIVNGRTLVPLRAVSEGFGAKVDWNDNIKQASITTVEDALVN